MQVVESYRFQANEGAVPMESQTPRNPPPGSSPGILVEDPSAPDPVIRVFAFSPTEVREATLKGPDEIREFLGPWPVTWVNVDGLGDVKVISRIGEIFSLHLLSLEDVVNVHQRAKVEDYDDHQFIVTRMPHRDERLWTEQMSMFLGPTFVLTFQETVGDCLDMVRDRIRKGRARLRTSGPDYLAYAILDAVLDAYFPIVEHYGEELDHIENEILEHPSRESISRIHDIKRDLLNLRRIIWHQRDALNLLIREGSDFVREETRVFLRDCYDHTIQLMDLTQTHLELASDLMDLYLSLSSNRMNEVIRFLTVFSSIFIPLTLVSSIYGMNFKIMPEIEWEYGYFFALALMASVALSLLYFFKRKRWI